MTLLYIDGFDADNATSLGLRGWSGTQMATTTGRISGSAIYSQSGATVAMTSPSVGAKATLIAGFAHLKTSLPGSPATIFVFYDSAGTTEQCSIRLNADGSLSACRGNQAAVLATSAAGVIAASVWRYIEVQATIDGSSGSMIVRVEESEVINVTAANTKQGSNAFADRVRFYSFANNNDRYDDLYIADTAGSDNNSFLGDCRVQTLLPASDAAIQWSRSTGSTNYSAVDDSPYSAADYVYSSTVGHVDRYGLSDLATTPASIKGVAMYYTYQKSDAGARTMRGFIKSGGTTSNDSAQTPALNTEQMRYALWERDPNTAAAWSTSGVNALEAGIEVVT